METREAELARATGRAEAWGDLSHHKNDTIWDYMALVTGQVYL